jgi:hypothetical protein
MTTNLKVLNQLLPPGQQLKIIILLYSVYSPKCKELITGITAYKQYFYFLNIDNPEIREKILNSSDVQVTRVPCFLVVQQDNTVAKYEGDKVLPFIKMIHDLHIKASGQQQKQARPTVVGSTQLTSLVNDGPPEPDNPFPSEAKMPPHKSPLIPIPVFRPPPGEIADLSGMGQSGLPGGAGGGPQTAGYDEFDEQSRKRVRRAQRPHGENNIAMVEPSDSDTGVSSLRSYMPRGMGHDGMSQSSLPVTQQKSRVNRPSGPISNGEMLDEEDIDSLMSLPSADMDPQISSTMSKGGDKKSKSEAMKRAVLEMQKMREDELNADDNR